MTNHSGLLEKESVAFASEKPNLREPLPNSSQIKKQHEKDDVLENALFGINLGESLTKREAEILNMIVAGNTNKEISQKISRSERTVEYHRNRLMGKLGAKTAADLVRRSIVMGIV